jgi:hypothetical protein
VVSELQGGQVKPDRDGLIKKFGERGLGQITAERLADLLVTRWQAGAGKWVVNSGEDRFSAARGAAVIYETPSQIIAVTVADVLNELDA